MLVRDVRTGNLVTVPDNRFYGAPAGYSGFGGYVPPSAAGFSGTPGLAYYAAPPQQVLYDGLGNPLGLPFLAALIPAAAALIPKIIGGAAAILPTVAKAASGLPGIISKVAGGLPSIAGQVLPMLTGGGGAPAPFAPSPGAPRSMSPHDDVANVRMRTTDGQVVNMPVRATPVFVQQRMQLPSPVPIRTPQTQRSFDGWPGMHGWYGY